MMTLKEACNIFRSNEKCKNLSILSCYEYDSCFVFQAVSENYVKSKDADKVFDSLYSVNKKDGDIVSFRPFHISVDEYRRGKKVKLTR